MKWLLRPITLVMLGWCITTFMMCPSLEENMRPRIPLQCPGLGRLFVPVRPCEVSFGIKISP